jgi:hypothetical protein
MPSKSPDLDLPAVNTIRTLATDAAQATNSGHPGLEARFIHEERHQRRLGKIRALEDEVRRHAA